METDGLIFNSHKPHMGRHTEILKANFALSRHLPLQDDQFTLRSSLKILDDRYENNRPKATFLAY